METAELGKRELHEEGQMEEAKPARGATIKQASKATLSAEVKEIMKTFRIVDGVAPVDEYVASRDRKRVCVRFGKTYSKILNQASVEENTNKFYILQMLEDIDSHDIFVYFRWGRIGVRGQDSLIPFGRNIGAAMAEFDSKFNDKAVEGRYEELDIIYGDEVSPEEQEQALLESLKNCKVTHKVGELITFIFSLKMMNTQIQEIGFDAKKTPLGKLSNANVKTGYTILKNILKEIETASSDWKQKVASFSNKFFTFIPHDVGFKDMSKEILDSEEKVHKKLEFLESVSNMKIAQSVIDQDKDSGIITVDKYYKGLKNDIKELAPESVEYKTIEKYLKSCLGGGIDIVFEIQDIYTVNREGEDQKFKPEVGNRKLLWHGSKMSNFASILSQGLKLPPAEAPSSAYKYGKGVYFTDSASKAAQYCHAKLSGGTGLILLADVALGTPNMLKKPDSNAGTLPAGFHSVQVPGKHSPDAKNAQVEEQGYTIPMGPLKANPDGVVSHNMYVVYNTDQIRARYLCKCRFI
jgi:poly [ADP-ribose] polymerase 2/3/4